MQDGIDEAKQLLADFSAKRTLFAEEREKAARILLEDLAKLEEFGWRIRIDRSGLVATFHCDHAQAGKVAFLGYDTTSDPPAWRLQIRDGGTNVQFEQLALDFNLALGRFEATTGSTDRRRPALLAIVEQVVDGMGK